MILDIKITITFHSDGTFEVSVEWISNNLSMGYELATPPCWG